MANSLLQKLEGIYAIVKTDTTSWDKQNISSIAACRNLVYNCIEFEISNVRRSKSRRLSLSKLIIVTNSASLRHNKSLQAFSKNATSTGVVPTFSVNSGL